MAKKRKRRKQDYRDKDWLHTYYVTHKHSVAIIADIAGCRAETIRYWLKKHCIRLRTPAEARSLEATLKRKVKSTSEDLCRAVGSFALSFERLCRDLRLGVWSVLEANGLDGAWECTDILVGDLTAFPLQSILRALIVQTSTLDEDEQRVIDILFGRVSRLAEERNTIIHSAWYIDYRSRPDLLSNVYVRYRPGYSKKGAKPTPTKHPITEVERSDKECHQLADLLDHLNDCLRMRHRIRDYFETVGKTEIKVKQR